MVEGLVGGNVVDATVAGGLVGGNVFGGLAGSSVVDGAVVGGSVGGNVVGWSVPGLGVRPYFCRPHNFFNTNQVVFRPVEEIAVSIYHPHPHRDQERHTAPLPFDPVDQVLIVMMARLGVWRRGPARHMAG